MDRSSVFFKVNLYDKPVLTKDNPGVKKNQSGFESGTIVKTGSEYHMFVTEMYNPPPAVVDTKIPYWSSNDGRSWRRISTLFTSTGDRTGTDKRAVLFGPNVVFDQEKQHWNLFYVAYRATKEYPNFDGRIYRAVSTGQGIGGPYKDVGVIMKPGKLSQSWEGHQGTDSFYPYKVGKTWYALYGSSPGFSVPLSKCYWKIGLASAPTLGGPWERMENINPISAFDQGENPIVTHLANGVFVAVFNYVHGYRGNISVAISEDGIHWKTGQRDIIKPRSGYWDSCLIRTPFGLIPEGSRRFTLFYSASGKLSGFRGIGISEWTMA